MAQGFPSGILDTVLKQLQSPIFQSTKLNYLLHTQLGDLRFKLELIKDVIDDAEFMGVLFPDVVGNWVSELQSVLYEVDDLLDEALTRSMPTSDKVEKVRTHIYNLHFLGLTLARKMKKMNKRLEGIMDKCHECNLIVLDLGNKKLIARKGILRYDHDYDEFEMVGRDDDKIKVINEMLLHNEDPRNAFIWITGLPGVGKTVLCRSVFDDAEVMKQFEIRLWFDSDGSDDPFDDFRKRIVTTLEEAYEARPQYHPETEEHDGIGGKTIRKGRKALFVFDSFPCEISSLSQYDDVKRYLKGLRDLIATSHKGSRIIFSLSTGGDKPVYFEYTDSHHKLENDLSLEHSWSIFRNMAFVPGHDIPEWMIELGAQIISKCIRNPAVLRGVGTLLYGNDNRAKWEYFAHDFDFNGPYDRYIEISIVNNVFQKCLCNLGYLSLFSKGEFKRTSLIHQFAAHGFANMPNAMLDRFDSLLTFSSKDNWDVEVNLTITPEVKVTVPRITGAESTTTHCMDNDLVEAARHMSIVRPLSSTVQQPQKIILPHSLIEDVPHRRTVLFLGEFCPIRMSVKALDALASNLRYLRVLDLHDLAIQELPSSVGKLIHLRYLDLSRNDFKTLPKSICRLKNLQTLKLVYCDKLRRLPRRIETLRRLKNMEISMCLDLTHMPSTISRLTCIEKLDRFVVSPHKGGLRYLENLDNLSGDVAIELPRGWNNSTVEAEQAKLERKKGLTTVRFKWPSADDGGDTDDGDDNNVVLDKLRPCNGIEYLSIVNFGGTKCPSWMMEISCVSEIVISKCKRIKMLPLFHRMPKLRLLTLISMNIEYLQDKNEYRSSDGSCAVVFFPALEQLKIGELPNLKGWSKDLGSIPKFPDITSLMIWNCPCLTVIPPISEIRDGSTLQAVSKEMLQLNDWSPSYRVTIISIPEMVSLPDQFVKKLPMKLKIKDCHQLQTLWTNEVEVSQTSESDDFVSSLSISNCSAFKLVSSNLRQLTYLDELVISKCSEELDCLCDEDEDGMPWVALRFLTHLKIKGFQKLLALPKGLQHPPMFYILDIVDCKSLKWEAGSLPTSLDKLRVKSCPFFSERIVEIKREYPCIDLQLD